MDKLAILIIGYDPYIDVWNTFFECINDNWKDRPKTYLITNEVTPSYDNVIVKTAGINAEWSQKVQIGIKEIKEDYICLLLEDFFISKPVKRRNIEDLINIIKINNAQYYKLLDQKKIKGNRITNDTYIIDKNEKYGVSLQPAIWEKSFLAELVGEENYNAWIFELNQVKNKTHIKENALCLGDNMNRLNIVHGVVQQEYLRNAVSVMRRRGYNINFENRKIMSIKKYTLYRMKQFFSWHTPKLLFDVVRKIGLLMVDYVSDREQGGKD